MATDFELKFGARNNSNIKPSGSKNQAEEKAEFWINVGYVAKGAGENGEDIFVALPLGIPLDTQKDVKANSNNPAFNNLQVARNIMLGELKEEAKKLQPGQDWIVDPDAPLTLQIRRVKEEVAQVTDPAVNKFLRRPVAATAE